MLGDNPGHNGACSDLAARAASCPTLQASHMNSSFIINHICKRSRETCHVPKPTARSSGRISCRYWQKEEGWAANRKPVCKGQLQEAVMVQTAL
jgi:hypothetical protein